MSRPFDWPLPRDSRWPERQRPLRTLAMLAKVVRAHGDGPPPGDFHHVTREGFERLMQAIRDRPRQW